MAGRSCGRPARQATARVDTTIDTFDCRGRDISVKLNGKLNGT
jgi:hypothetical protein